MKDFNYDTLLEKLSKKEPFQFLRFGDGEMKCVLHPGSGANCDGHQYFDKLSQALISVLDQQNKKQTCYMGLQNLGARIFPHFKDRWPHIEWCNADVLHKASIKGRLGELLKLIPYQKCMFVGPAYLKLLGYSDKNLRSIPRKDCFLDYGPVKDCCLYNIQHENVNVIYFSCSMMAEPLIHEISQLHPEVTMIDAGSVWDPYCGVSTRTYHQKIIETINQ